MRLLRQLTFDGPFYLTYCDRLTSKIYLCYEAREPGLQIGLTGSDPFLRQSCLGRIFEFYKIHFSRARPIWVVHNTLFQSVRTSWLLLTWTNIKHQAIDIKQTWYRTIRSSSNDLSLKSLRIKPIKHVTQVTKMLALSFCVIYRAFKGLRNFERNGDAWKFSISQICTA